MEAKERSMITNMKKKDRTKGCARTAIGLLLMAWMVIVGALLPGGTVEAAPAIEFTEVIDGIEQNKTGSITIHKYEYNGDDGIRGTGKPGDDVPAEAKNKPLEDVEFTIYQVKNASELEEIYNGTPAADENADKMPTLAIYWDTNNGKWQSGMPDGTLTKQGDSAKTNENGEVTFSNLPIGIYLVVETDAPSQVTKKSAFLVSIPTTVDYNSWLYDVHVFPKNATTYGKDVTLIKKGSGEEKLAGVTFVLQRKKADDTWEGVTITDDSGKAVALTTNTDGEIKISALPPGTYRLIETNIGDNFGYIGDFSKTYEFEVNPNGTIKDAGKDYITVDAITGSATITVTNEKPNVEKKVKGKDGNGKEDWVQNADYSVGDTISYQIKVTVPENIANLKTFKVTDTPNHIKYTTETLKVYQEKDGKMGTADTDKIEAVTGAITNYTLTEDESTNGFTVTFNTKSATIIGKAGENIYITYDAVLQEGAVNVNGIVNAGNTNTVQLIYSRYAKPETEPGDYPEDPGDPEDKIEDTAVVYTFQLDIVKEGEEKNEDGTNKGLIGVTFDLYQETTEGDAEKVADELAKAAGLDIGSDADKKYWKKINGNDSLTTDNNGKISVKGLKSGTYYLVETKTNDGYNLLSKPVEVVLSAEYSIVYKDDYDSKDDKGNYIYIKHEIDGDNTTITQKIAVNKGTASVIDEITILNTKGFTLPTTGGMGGFVFAVVGCMVMIAGILLFKKTKKKPESE
ncbi:MAG: SpaH/EbpB family LPXTG-anchored major pilin [Muribaculaceae bacterium]|nr:SpaH/EbpB family LPXTG-anchored major pilin [Muribaculaceae bacterium]